MNRRELFEAFLKEEKRYEKLKENFEEKVQKHLSLLKSHEWLNILLKFPMLCSICTRFISKIS